VGKTACTLVPAGFFDPDKAFDILAAVAEIDRNAKVAHIEIPQYNAVLVYCNDDISGRETKPEMFFVLDRLLDCTEYNKILCSWRDGQLNLAIAQGRTLLLANTYDAADFTTAQYYIFLAVKSLQLNPEVSVLSWLSDIPEDGKMSLYRYFKDVTVL